jgi:hypothetical protein
VIVRRAVAPLRQAACAAAINQRRFETGPGEQAQYDWGQVTVPLGGIRTEIHICVMTLGYSRRGFALCCLRERMADLLAAHEAAFAHFGGRCEFLLYDRMCNALAHAGKTQRRMVSAAIGTVFVQDSADNARTQWRSVADQLRGKFPKLEALMDESENDALAFMTLPRAH